MEKNRFIYGSVIMVVMNFFLRIIGFVYDVSLSKLLGAEAMGLIQLGMSTLMTFLILTISGIPTAITKLVAEQHSKKNYEGIENIYKSTMMFNFIASVFISIIVILSAEYIAINIFKNKDMLTGVYLLVPAIIIYSLSNILRSFFYGIRNMIIPSIAQIIEHLTRLIVVVGLIIYLSPKNPTYGAIIAILGMSIGEFFDLMWSIFAKRFLLRNKPKVSTSITRGLPSLMKILTLSIPKPFQGFLM